MRTKEKWVQKHLPKELQQFTPRIQEVLEQSYLFDNLPTDITSMFLQAKAGYGKTIYAASLLLQEKQNLYLEGRVEDCYFVNVPDLFSQLKRSYDNKAAEKEHEILDKYSYCHLLVLDDLGTLKPSDWILQTLYLILNRRYEYLKKTIITSNCNLKEVAGLLDDRIVSRIERMCKIIEKKHWSK